MTADEVVRRNLDLHAEWMRYVFENPSVLEQIPAEATLVFVPDDAPELAAENMKAVESARGSGFPVVIIRMKTPTPQVPQIEVVAA